MKTILFYSPYMGYTGSEMMIKYIANSIKSYNCVIISGEKGELLNTVSLSIKAYVYPEQNISFYRINKVINNLLKFNLTNLWFRKIIRKHKPSLIILNTVVVSKILPLIKECQIPFLLYSHELPPMYDLIKKQDLEWLVSHAKGAIGCSSQVYQNLKHLGIKNVELFYECINTAEFEIDENLYIQKKEELKKFRAVFLMSGQRAYHKGYHLLPLMQDFLKSQNAALIWLGNPSNYGMDYYVTRQLKDSNIILPGHIKNRKEYYTWIKLADAFVLTSIIDPYPLVMLEAAYMQKPILAFNSGGVSEFVKEGMGFVINSFNVNDLINTLQKFMQDEISIDYEKLRQEAIKHDIQNNIDKFEQFVSKYLE